MHSSLIKQQVYQLILAMLKKKKNDDQNQAEAQRLNRKIWATAFHVKRPKASLIANILYKTANTYIDSGIYL